MPIYIFSPKLNPALSIAKLLKKNDYKIKLIAAKETKSSLGRVIKYYDYVCETKEALLRRRKGDILLPIGAISTKYLLIKDVVKINGVELNKNALKVFDKIWSIRKAFSLNIPAPETWNNYKEIQPVEFPIFYKQKFERGTGDRGVAKKPDEIPEEVSDLIFQEYISSPGTYGVGFIAKNGKILVQHTHFEKESFPKDGGSAVILEKFEDKRLVEYTQRLLEDIGYSGWGLAEYKYCHKREDYVFMEINAKFWASCEFAFRNEPKFFKLLFNLDIPKENLERVIYINRAFLRGPVFITKNIRTIINSERIIYPGWYKSFLLGIFPKRILFFLNKNIHK